MIAYADHHQLGWDIRMRRADEPIPSQAYCLVNHHERTPAADDSKTVALFGQPTDPQPACVHIDDAACGQLAARHLFAQGYQHACLIESEMSRRDAISIARYILSGRMQSSPNASPFPVPHQPGRGRTDRSLAHQFSAPVAVYSSGDAGPTGCADIFTAKQSFPAVALLGTSNHLGTCLAQNRTEQR